MARESMHLVEQETPTDPAPPIDAALERGAKRVSWVWPYILAAIALVSSGFGASTALLTWQVDALRKVQLDTSLAIRQDIGALRADIKAESLTRNGMSERLVRIETTVGLMPTDRLASMKRANASEANRAALQGNEP